MRATARTFSGNDCCRCGQLQQIDCVFLLTLVTFIKGKIKSEGVQVDRKCEIAASFETSVNGYVVAQRDATQERKPRSKVSAL